MHKLSLGEDHHMDEKIVYAFFAVIALIGLVFIYLGLTQGSAIAPKASTFSRTQPAGNTGFALVGMRMATGAPSDHPARYSNSR